MSGRALVSLLIEFKPVFEKHLGLVYKSRAPPLRQVLPSPSSPPRLQAADHGDVHALRGLAAATDSADARGVAQAQQAERWRKVLYTTQPFEDNFVAASFLAQMTTNGGWDPRNSTYYTFKRQELLLLLLLLTRSWTPAAARSQRARARLLGDGARFGRARAAALRRPRLLRASPLTIPRISAATSLPALRLPLITLAVAVRVRARGRRVGGGAGRAGRGAGARGVRRPAALLPRAPGQVPLAHRANRARIWRSMG